ncbi:MAG: tRNA (adenosine(37)-N6)-dimethylallyltransferase MiaA [Bacteroidetes bacterium]|nr:tRNA (adenosine(37)-N6)-dimethylallyltransferase MiaA [Bacteroidota bacterium]
MSNILKKKKLTIICGPTAVGKTRYGALLAKQLKTEVISADSRQFYRELRIGTASPTPEEMMGVPHHFIGHLFLTDYYNVSLFEQDVLCLLEKLFARHDEVIMVGGSGLYIDAVCRGIDDFPDADPVLRKMIKEELNAGGLEPLRQRLLSLDPEYYHQVDLNNPNRVMRAIEVCLVTGRKYSEQRTSPARERVFEIGKIGLNTDRGTLFRRIEDRVDSMMEAGLLEEVRSLTQYRHLNALNTVGYKELFNYLDGIWTLPEAIEKIKTNTRRYAKRQLTWFKRDESIQWIEL